MPTKRHALVLRLWQVKTETAPSATELTEADTETCLDKPTGHYHWRGAVQIAGDTHIHYFDSWPAMNHIIEQIVNESC